MLQTLLWWWLVGAEGAGRGGGEGTIDVALTIIQNFNGWSFLALSPKKFLACNHVTM